MKKIIAYAFSIVLMFSVSTIINPETVKAQESEWQYASIAYFETDLIDGWMPAIWIATECTSDSGSSCTEPGAKSRGLIYTIHPFINF